MKGGFEEEFHIELVEGKLSKEERDLAKQFEKESFSTKEWNHRR
jgi:lipoate-protein ligase A